MQRNLPGLRIAELRRLIVDSANATHAIIQAVRELEGLIDQEGDPGIKVRLSRIADDLTDASAAIVSSASTTASGLEALASSGK